MSLRLRLVLVGLLLVPGLLAGAPAARAADSAHSAHSGRGVVRVDGAVDAPAHYTREQLAALPQTTLTDQRTGRHRGQALTGVLLQTVIERAEPQLPEAKNPTLRVAATVAGRHHRAVATAFGELDPSFGNHPGLLVLARDGRVVRGAPELVFPGDDDQARSVAHVREVTVRVAPTAAVDVPVGTLAVSTERGTVNLTSARLAALRQQARTVTYLASGVAQTRVETGPTLADVLRAAHVRTGSATSVAATATDGYVAAVTPGEATSGGRPLLVSLVEDGVRLERPRLVPAGDVRGGRYVSDLTTLSVVDDGCW